MAQSLMMPNICLSAQDFYKADDDRTDLIPYLGLVFGEWYRSAKYAMLRDSEFKSWPCRMTITQAEPVKAGQTNYAAFYFSVPDARKVWEAHYGTGALQSVLRKLFLTEMDKHVVRLLDHLNAPDCHLFALACIRFIDQYEDCFLRKAVPRSLDGYAAMVFFTIAPYLFVELKAKYSEQ